MPTIKCPVPGCDTTWNATLPEAVLTRLMDGHATHVHPIEPTVPCAMPTAQAEKVRRPSINQGITAEDFNYFLLRWSDYKVATQLKPTETIFQLLECCEEHLRRDLSRSYGSLTALDETKVINLIKTIAVKQENVMVARHTFHHMTQDREEPIRNFAARLRGQAATCQFSTKCSKCTNIVDYSNIEIRDVLIRGLNDPDIRENLFMEEDQGMELDKAICLIEAKEAGRRSIRQLNNSQGDIAAASSSYKKSQRVERRTAQVQQLHPGRQQNSGPHMNRPNNPCSYCGRRGHSSLRNERMQLCPAYGHTCKHCQKRHHFENVCRSQGVQAKASPIAADHFVDDSGAIFQTLCPSQGLQTQASPIMTDHFTDENDVVLQTLCSISLDVDAHTDSLLTQTKYQTINLDTNLDTNSLLDNTDHKISTIGNFVINKQQNIENSITAQPHQTNTITIDHHIYNDLIHAWERRSSDPQPFIDVSVSAEPADLRDLGHTSAFTATAGPVTTPAMADTGCQSTLAGVTLLKALGLNPNQLLKTTTSMSAANKSPIHIMGALPLRITGHASDGKVLTTHQLVYFTPSTDKLFLSKDACVSLHIVPKSFPSVGSTQAAMTTKKDDRTCNCPKRTTPPPKPTTLPYPAIDENREAIEKWIIDYYKSSVFNMCEHQPLPMMSGPAMRIQVDEDIPPVAHHSPIPVAIHWQEKVKAGLDRDVELGVLEPVPIGTPVTWCSRMVIAAKKSGEPRRTVDFQGLNKHAVRETHHTQSPSHLARSIPPNTYKTTLDAWNGYHSIPLHPDDSHFTTFITPWGRYRYRVAPQGFISSGDNYTKRYDEILTDIPRKIKCIDDTILWDESIEEAFYHTIDFLDTCGKNGVVLNTKPKFGFALKTVVFAGFEISPYTVSPCPKSVEAIQLFPIPKNITDIRSWFGLVNQISYAFAVAPQMAPFRSLLKPGAKFVWTETLQQAFQQSKQVIINDIKKGVEIYDKDLPTCLVTDWSKEGIGYWLLQKHCNCSSRQPLCCKSGWRVTLIGSRFTTGAESRYSPVEGEALAIVDALDKARHYVLGCPDLTIATDHNPLVKLFGDRSLEAIPNPRLLRLKERSLRYKFQIKHIPGVRNAAADALSRHPVGNQDVVEQHQETFPVHMTSLAAIRTLEPHQSEICMANGNSSTIIQSITWQDVQLATSNDETMMQLYNLIEEGIPEKRAEWPEDTRHFFRFREDLSCFDNVLLYKDRVVIPESLQSRVLDSLHSAHQGTSQMTSRAESSFFWPGMTPDIANHRAKCQECNRMAPSQPNAPPTPPTLPVYPFQCIAADYFNFKGRNYVVIIDRYSNWPIVEMANEGASGLVACLRRIFVTYGISEELTSDGGPQFTARVTQEFLQNWGVLHRLTSVAYPHANTRAELGVKTVKRMLTDNTDQFGSLNTDAFQRAMLQYRNTPEPDSKLSPAMCLFGRAIRDFIPIHPGKYEPHPTWKSTLQEREIALRKRHMKAHEQLSEHTRHLPPLRVGDSVRIQNQVGPHPTKWDKTGLIIEVRQFDQYVIRVDGSGRVTIRNRKFLRKFIPAVARPILQGFPTKTADYTSQIPELIRQPTNIIQPSIDKPNHIQTSSSPNDQHNDQPETPMTTPTPPRLLAPPATPMTTPTPPRLLASPSPGPHHNILPSSIPTPQKTKQKRIPTLLKRLQAFNEPGLAE